MDIENAEGFNIMEISYIDILKRNQLVSLLIIEYIEEI